MKAGARSRKSGAGIRNGEPFGNHRATLRLRAPLIVFAILVGVHAQASPTFAREEPRTQNRSAPQPGSNAPDSAKKSNVRPADSTKRVPEPFDGASVEKMAAQCVTLETESGAIEMEMLAEAAPETVRNFLNLAATGAFDTTTFGRVVKDFVIQGGNLSTREKITPELALRAARKIADEPNYVKHVRGVVSMARPEEANSATTNFFILINQAPHLDGKFAAFGRVVRGMDVADAINLAPAENEKPAKPVRVARAVVAPCAVKAETPKG